MHQVIAIPRDETPAVVAVLCDAFSDYPVMRHVLADSEGDYADNLNTLIGFFVGARVWRGEPVIGIEESGTLTATAILTPPGQRQPPRELLEQRERVWRQLGPEARARYEYLGNVWPKVGVTEPNLHLNMIGIRRDRAGRGLGRALLDAIHAMSERDPDSTGVSLTTETAANVPFYEHCGYDTVGHEQIVDGLETWGFFRPDTNTGRDDG